MPHSARRSPALRQPVSSMFTAPASHHCASGANTSPKPSGPLSIKASHARRTSSISGLSPIAVIVAHPLAGGCGPFAVRFCSPCGPFAVSRPTNSREHERTRSRQTQRLRRFSRVFAAVRPSLRQSGRTVRVGLNEGDSGFCGGICGGPDRTHTGPRVRRDPVYAIANARTMLLTSPAGRRTAAA